jgi:murein tripeptide amidase MpaA
MSTNQLANRFGPSHGCVSMTLEMPFKDYAEFPDPAQGWSPERSRLLARDCLAALAEWLETRSA